MLLGAAVFAGISALLLVGTVAVARLDAHVETRMLETFPDAHVDFVDLPSPLHPLALADLHNAVAGLLNADWTDEALCQRIAERVSRVGWIARLNHVRRTSDARFEVSAVYRMPLAMIQRGTEFFLVDREAYRLPGQYRHDPAWYLIQGVGAPPPEPGRPWPGDDIHAGLALLQLLVNEPYAHQITAVLVDNFNGRLNRLASHIELATDRAGGRIRWGSAPGREFEENKPANKLAILRANFTATGRCDANYPIIDVSTFPDRFTVPN
jgi:hypothetical protein